MADPDQDGVGHGAARETDFPFQSIADLRRGCVDAGSRQFEGDEISIFQPSAFTDVGMIGRRDDIALLSPVLAEAVSRCPAMVVW